MVGKQFFSVGSGINGCQSSPSRTRKRAIRASQVLAAILSTNAHTLLQGLQRGGDPSK